MLPIYTIYFATQEIGRLDMSEDAIMEMICDWEAMGEMYCSNGGAREWYKISGDRMIMTNATRQRLETILENLEKA